MEDNLIYNSAFQVGFYIKKNWYHMALINTEEKSLRHVAMVAKLLMKTNQNVT